MKHFDYLVVGAGLAGATTARLLLDKGKSVLILEKRNHIGGNIYTEVGDGIPLHLYGPHIFHTDQVEAWEFFKRYADVYDFINSPIAFYKGERYHLPFNLNTFEELWGVKSAEEARAKIAEEIALEKIVSPSNLEEQALSMVGRSIYFKLIKGYTEKQWGRDCKDLPPSIIKRLPLRFERNNNYFNDKYQGLPRKGYTPFVMNLLNGAEVKLGIDYFEEQSQWDSLAGHIIYTGRLDEYFHFDEGHLEWRSLRFEHQKLDTPDYQSNPVVNYTDREIPYTRITEHKHFDPLLNTSTTIISKEYPDYFEEGKIPYYTINDKRNEDLAAIYKKKASSLKNVSFLGRLASYRYLDMDDTIIEAMKLAKTLLNS